MKRDARSAQLAAIHVAKKALGLDEETYRLAVATCSNGRTRSAGEHDALLAAGWHTRTWTARKGYAVTDEAVANAASETLWCSPACVPLVKPQVEMFA
jgi:hypothetical protein